MVINEACLEAHDLCFEAREGFNGTLDYGFLGKVMDLMRFDDEEQLDVIYKIKQVESFLREQKKNADNAGT